MNSEKLLGEFFLKGQLRFLRHVSVDCVIFGFHDGQLKVLLLKMKGGSQWCLPGGFVKKTESVDDSAIRTLRERTGLDRIYLQQFHAFGHPNRDKHKPFSVPRYAGSWIAERFITVGYYALVEFSKVKPKADAFSDECRWWDVDTCPRLIYDHNLIMTEALKALRTSLSAHPVGFNLLPRKFTMPDLQKLYETILGRPLDRRNFQKKMLSLGILSRLVERKTGGAHKAPYLYKFNSHYHRAVREGLGREMF